jgi:hypothetical protein
VPRLAPAANDEENERMVAELERLDTRGRPLTPEEERAALSMSF